MLYSQTDSFLLQKWTGLSSFLAHPLPPCSAAVSCPREKTAWCQSELQFQSQCCTVELQSHLQVCCSNYNSKLALHYKTARMNMFPLYYKYRNILYKSIDYMVWFLRRCVPRFNCDCNLNCLEVEPVWRGYLCSSICISLSWYLFSRSSCSLLSSSMRSSSNRCLSSRAFLLSSSFRISSSRCGARHNHPTAPQHCSLHLITTHCTSTPSLYPLHFNHIHLNFITARDRMTQNWTNTKGCN